MADETSTTRTPKRPGRLRRILRIAGWGVLGLLVLLAVAVGAFLFHVGGVMDASLPPVDGTREVPGLEAPVAVERDRFGAPTLRGESRKDLGFALGFVHGQERFFQMDVLRRIAAGESGELMGSPAFFFDRRLRPLRYRNRARQAMESAAPDVRALVTAYTDGVNAGLASLDEPPFEYAALWTEPRPWTPEDTYLVMLSLFFELQDVEGWIETGVSQTYDCLPREMADFLTPMGTLWDAPISGGPIPTPAIPGPDVYSLRSGSPAPKAPQAVEEAARVGTPPGLERPGSNAWAVAPSRTAQGQAILANDVHMGMTMPNLWYRATLVWPEAGEDGGTNRVVGLTVPGIPVVLVGSNGSVAWGVTNAPVDTVDVIRLELDPDDPTRYRTPDGWRPFETYRETLRGRAGQEEEVEYSWTVWGRRIEDDPLGRPQALRSIVDEPGAMDLEVWRLEAAKSVEESMELANRSGVPPQNFVVADAEGRIGWTLLGRLPRRVGYEGRLTDSWADGARRWDGLLPPEDVPRVVDPEDGLLWSANNRPVGGDDLELLGDGGYLLGARALQIRDALQAMDGATAEDMLALQLDDRAVFFERWRDLLVELLSSDASDGSDDGDDALGAPTREVLDAVRAWDGRAAADSVGFRAVWRFREVATREIFDPLLAPCREQDPRYWIIFATPQYEGPLWRLVTEKPEHLLPPEVESWDAHLRRAARTAVEELTAAGPLAERTWGEQNRIQPHHPFSLVAPPLSRWLDPPARPMAGWYHMPLLQTPGFGPTVRLVVTPGREEEGLFQMPGGQSGNPRSPHYTDLHEYWARGESVPLLPGPPEDVLHLVPLDSGRTSP